MTVKISVSLPNDVAERLALQPNVSAYVTDALRYRMSMERTYELLRRSGYDITAADIERGKEILDAASQQMTPDLAAQADALIARRRRDA